MESQKEVKITEEDVIGMMDLFTKVPPLMLKMVISRNSNVVKRFESRIEGYKSQMSDGDSAKIEKVLEMPVPELQSILGNAYEETHQKQLKLLADPKAEPFIEKNLQELRKILK